MRHATPEDLDRLENLLRQLRLIPQLRERKRGYFSRGSRAILHFHAEGEDLFVDIRLDTTFERMKVTTDKEQSELLLRIRNG